MLQKSKLIIPFAPVERLMKENCNIRVSDSAIETMTEDLITIGKKISERAWKIARHSGRKTVQGIDIKLAYEHIYKL